jgi:methionyl-tRNA formyltransferase
VSAPYTDPADPLHGTATRAGVPVVRAGTLTAETLPGNVDLIVAAHSHDFIGRKTRLKCRLGAIGYHPSLLPLHRGRAAVEWQIRMRERVAGGTVYWLDDTVDGGPVAAQDFCLVRPEDTARSLWRRELFPMGLGLLERALKDLEAGVMVRRPQDHTLATWEPALDPPPLKRPDLVEIGPGWEGLRVVTSRENAPEPGRATEEEDPHAEFMGMIEEGRRRMAARA